MLRAKTPTGWILIRHPDHAALAGEFASLWGNDRFRIPQPSADVIEGIRRHDDGWAARDERPLVTRQGRPSAFGADLVGKYTAFEEIDLPEYLGVRGNALEIVARDNPYAAILISLHTCNLLTEHADRSTIKPDELPRLDAFVARQRHRQLELRAECASKGTYLDEDLTVDRLTEHFRVLQACDNLSLLSCVDYPGPATLLHPLPLNNGETQTVDVLRVGPRVFRLQPWPFLGRNHAFTIRGRAVRGDTFGSHEELQQAYGAGEPVTLSVELFP